MMLDNSKHRALHKKTSDGRDREIEGYIEKTFEWYYNAIRPHVSEEDQFLDVGTDYGFSLDLARIKGFKNVFGIEPSPTNLSLEDPHIFNCSLEEFARKSCSLKTHVFMNHVLEHLENPISDLRTLVTNQNIASILIATPDSSGPPEYVWAPGHVWSFDPAWFSDIMEGLFPDYYLVKQDIKCFRNGWKEIWNVFFRKGLIDERS